MRIDRLFTHKIEKIDAKPKGIEAMNRNLLMETIDVISETYGDAITTIETTCRDSIQSAREQQRLDFIAVVEQHPAEQNQKKAIEEARQLFPLINGEASAELSSALRKIREDYGTALKLRDQAIADLRLRTADDYGKKIATAEETEKQAIAIVDEAFSAYVKAAAVAVIQAAQERASKVILSRLG